MGRIAAGERRFIGGAAWILVLALLVGPVAWPAAAQDIAGTWQGTANLGQPARIVMKISKVAGTDKAGWKAVLYSLDMGDGSEGREATSVVLEGQNFRLAIATSDVRYEGKVGADGASIVGTLTWGGQPFPLNLVRANEETEWKAEATKRMAADADPAFDVATVKPTDPKVQSSGFHSGDGRRINCDNQTLADILQFAYGIHWKQIVGAPDWVGTDKWDIDGYPDAPGVPNYKQMQAMYRKIVDERFGLKMHKETRSMSVYAISVEKGGSKLVKSMDQDGMSDTTGRSTARSGGHCG
jgi:hypothetical protein